MASRNQVYGAIEDRVRTVVAPPPFSLDPSRVYLAGAPIFVNFQTPYIQIVPQPVVDNETEGGAYGHRVETFQVHAWGRLQRDQAGQDSDRMANDTDSILKLLDAIEGEEGSPGLHGSSLGGLLNSPIRWIQGTSGVKDVEHPGWIMFWDTYRMSYFKNVPQGIVDG